MLNEQTDVPKGVSFLDYIFFQNIFLIYVFQALSPPSLLSFHLVFLLKYICIGAWTFFKSFPCFMWWLSLDTLFVPYRW